MRWKDNSARAPDILADHREKAPLLSRMRGGEEGRRRDYGLRMWLAAGSGQTNTSSCPFPSTAVTLTFTEFTETVNETTLTA